MMVFDYTQLSGLKLYGSDIMSLVMFGAIVLGIRINKPKEFMVIPSFWIFLLACIASASGIIQTYNSENELNAAHNDHTIGKAVGVLIEERILEKDSPSPTYVYSVGHFNFARRSRYTGAGRFCFEKINLKDYVNKNVIIHYRVGNYEVPNVPFKTMCITKFEVVDEAQPKLDIYGRSHTCQVNQACQHPFVCWFFVLATFKLCLLMLQAYR